MYRKIVYALWLLLISFVVKANTQTSVDDILKTNDIYYLVSIDDREENISLLPINKLDTTSDTNTYFWIYCVSAKNQTNVDITKYYYQVNYYSNSYRPLQATTFFKGRVIENYNFESSSSLNNDWSPITPNSPMDLATKFIHKAGKWTADDFAHNVLMFPTKEEDFIKKAQKLCKDSISGHHNK